MRCLALGQAWKDSGGKVAFVTACSSQTVLGRLRAEDFVVRQAEPSCSIALDWKTTREAINELGDGEPDVWLVLDGRSFDGEYQKRAKDGDSRVMVIDDDARLPHYLADVVLNQNIPSRLLTYSREPDTKLLWGARYALLRREFLKWRSWEREIPEVGRRLLITFGAADPTNATSVAIRALEQVGLDSFEAVAVVGPANPRRRELEREIASSRQPIHLVENPADVSALMAWADLAVIAGGGTLWEALCMGLPVVTYGLLPFQDALLRRLARRGVVAHHGFLAQQTESDLAAHLRHIALAREVRARMSRKGRRLIDGAGASRVVAALQSAR